MRDQIPSEAEQTRRWPMQTRSLSSKRYPAQTGTAPEPTERAVAARDRTSEWEKRQQRAFAWGQLVYTRSRYIEQSRTRRSTESARTGRVRVTQRMARDEATSAPPRLAHFSAPMSSAPAVASPFVRLASLHALALRIAPRRLADPVLVPLAAMKQSQAHRRYVQVRAPLNASSIECLLTRRAGLQHLYRRALKGALDWSLALSLPIFITR